MGTVFMQFAGKKRFSKPSKHTCIDPIYMSI